jgi:aspartate-semialdehyde dehydrogenase
VPERLGQWYLLSTMETYNIGILGATGLVGQRMVERLEGHPWFRVSVLAASDRSSGRLYAEAVDWRLSADPPEYARRMQVRSCVPEELANCDLVLSALDTEVARSVEPSFASAGFAVISNSSAYRHEAAVPLLVPEINSEHLRLLEGGGSVEGAGYIVTNPNCSVTGLALAVAPLHRRYGVRRLLVATLQAVSGAGADGPRAMEMLDNVVPFIPGEEEKFEPELRKILGSVGPGGIEGADLTLSAHCHRVPTLDGHLEAVSVELRSPASPEEVADVLEAFRGELADLGLPSAPRRPVRVRREVDRPQPLLDRDRSQGMAVTVGRVRRCPVLGIKFVLLSHNTVRGAAGGALLNAELLAARALLPRRKPL